MKHETSGKTHKRNRSIRSISCLADRMNSMESGIHCKQTEIFRESAERRWEIVKGTRRSYITGPDDAWVTVTEPQANALGTIEEIEIYKLAHKILVTEYPAPEEGTNDHIIYAINKAKGEIATAKNISHKTQTQTEIQNK